MLNRIYEPIQLPDRNISVLGGDIFSVCMVSSSEVDYDTKRGWSY